MGMPYSKEVHAAFEQVTPLVAAGFEVLRTTKNIAILLAVIQVFVALILTLTLFAILALVYSVNPDLEDERRTLVTPAMQWLASWIIEYGTMISWLLRLSIVLSTAGLGIFVWHGSVAEYYVAGAPSNEIGEEDDVDDFDSGE